MDERDDINRVIGEDAEALRRRTTRSMPPLSAVSPRRERRTAPFSWRPRFAVTIGILALLFVVAIGAVASERFRRLLIPVRGRSAAAIEQEVKGGLAGEGFSNPSVRVERNPDSLRIALSARDSSGAELETIHAIAGGGVDSVMTLELPDFHDLDHLPLEERRSAIERRLRERGIQATVRIVDGRIRIDADERRITREKR